MGKLHATIEINQLQIKGVIMELKTQTATMAIKWKLNQLMFERGVKNQELCEITGLHPNTISKLKNLREMPDRLEKNTLDLLCKALDCNPGDLLIRVEEVES